MTGRIRVLAVVAVLGAQLATAQAITVSNDIVLVPDPSGAINSLLGMNNMSIFPSKQEQFCRAAYNAARAGGLADEFDGVITFTGWEGISDIDNVWQGSPVRSDGSGYARQNSPTMNSYTSSKIGQCVFMGTLGRTQGFFGPGPEALPSNPDADWSPSLGVPIPGVSSLTGIEMMGHEYGHHWLLGIEFDQNDGRGKQHFIRGFSEGSSEGGQAGSPNQHYSHYADSRSVMYGSCITDNGNGSFTVKGCVRKYSHVDQYLMGLRSVNEIDPMMVLEDPADPGKGRDTIAFGRSSSGMTVNGYTRHDITGDEIVRAMGARIPASPGARRCWRVAFVVVLPPGQTALSQAMLDKVKRYKDRWGPWFNFATDGRGTMDARIMGNGCETFGSDAGVIVEPVDAGQPPVDAGTSEEDAGVIEPDAGAEVPDAGELVETPVDAGMEGPGKWDTYVPYETGKIRPGCGCSVPGGGEALAFALAAFGLLRRRSRR